MFSTGRLKDQVIVTSLYNVEEPAAVLSERRGGLHSRVVFARNLQIRSSELEKTKYTRQSRDDFLTKILSPRCLLNVWPTEKKIYSVYKCDVYRFNIKPT